MPPETPGSAGQDRITTTAAPTSPGWTEVLSAYLYDWNQDGSSALRGSTFATDAEGVPQVGQRVVLYGDGLAVVVTVTKVERSGNDGWCIDTTWQHLGAGSVRYG